MNGSLNPPMVTIYIPTHNRRDLLARALDSVFSQTYQYYEIIVVDDASTDGTREMLESLASSGKIRMLRFSTPRGAQAARNHALSSARFDLVTGLDDDDEWLPDRLHQLVSSFKPGVGFVAASDIIERGDGKQYVSRRPSHITHDMLLRRNVVGNQVLARASDLLACGGFDETVSASQDHDLWIRLSALVGDGIGLRAPLQIVHAQMNRKRVTTSTRRKHGVWRVYRKHRDSMTPSQRRSHMFNMLRTVERRISMKTVRALWSREDGIRILVHWLRGLDLVSDSWLELVASLRDRTEIRTVLARCPTRTQRDGNN